MISDELKATLENPTYRQEMQTSRLVLALVLATHRQLELQELEGSSVADTEYAENNKWVNIMSDELDRRLPTPISAETQSRLHGRRERYSALIEEFSKGPEGGYDSTRIRGLLVEVAIDQVVSRGQGGVRYLEELHKLTEEHHTKLRELMAKYKIPVPGPSSAKRTARASDLDPRNLRVYGPSLREILNGAGLPRSSEPEQPAGAYHGTFFNRYTGNKIEALGREADGGVHYHDHNDECHDVTIQEFEQMFVREPANVYGPVKPV